MSQEGMDAVGGGGGGASSSLTEAFEDIFPYAAPIFSVSLFLCGVPTCLQFVRQGGVDGKRPGPFVAGAASCAVWTKYGLVLGDGTVTGVNLAGMALYSAYVAVYVSYAGKALARQVVRVALGMCLAFALFLHYVDGLDRPSMLSVTGSAAAVSTVCFASSSLDAIKNVFRDRSTKCLQKPHIFMTCASTSLWCLHGLASGNDFVYYPNLAAAALAAAQAALVLGWRWIVPPRRPPAAGAAEGGGEEGAKVLVY